MSKIFLVLLVTVFCSPIAFAQDSLNVSILGIFEEGVSGAVGLDLRNEYVYLAAGQSGLRIVDVGDPSAPVQLGVFDSYGTAMDAEAAIGFVYLADGGESLAAVDVSDPHSPQLADMLYYYSTRAVSHSGNYVYCAHGSDCISGCDVSDPYDLDYSGDYDTPGSAEDVEIVGNYVFVADGYSGLRIIDATNPNQLTEVGSFDTPGFAENLEVFGAFVYIADGEYGLRIIDISNPENPNEVGFLDTPGYAQGVTIEGEMAFMADAESGLRVINISNSMEPFEVGFYDTPDEAFAVSVSDGIAYVADYFSLLILDCTPATHVPQDRRDLIPLNFEIHPVYPNPFNSSAILTVKAPASTFLSINLYNTLGRQIAVLANSQVQAGHHLFTIDASDMASGLYFVRVTVPGQLNQVQTVMLVR